MHKKVEVVRIDVVYSYDDAWGCYMDGRLVDQDNGTFSADRLIKVLGGRAVIGYDWHPIPELPDENYPESLPELLEWVSAQLVAS